MCGIVGVIGSKNIIEIVVDGLKKLEYRGYDSAGIALLEDGVFKTVKEEGKIVNLEKAIIDSDFQYQAQNKTQEELDHAPVFAAKKSVDVESVAKNLKVVLSGDDFEEGALAAKDQKIVIGHTRWATHGGVNQENSHPHASSRVCVVHNGIVENYQEIRQKLIADGAKFLSETDSEVIPHLLEKNLEEIAGKNKANKLQIQQAIQKTLSEIDGSYALAIIFRDNPEFMVIAKKGSPLLVGLGDEQNYIASDYYALADYTNKVVYLNDDEFAFVGSDYLEVFDVNGKNLPYEIKEMEALDSKVSKGDFDHFMLKEIYEQPKVLEDSLSAYVDFENGNINLPNFPFDLTKINKITMIACGTSYYAAMAMKYIFEEVAKIEVEVDIASEFRYRRHPFRDDNLMMFISQSGETADTIAALKYARENGQKILSVVNVAQSSMAQLSDGVIKTIAGTEIGVASTKAYTAQIAAMSIFAVNLAEIRGVIADEQKAQCLNSIKTSSSKISEILSESNIENIQKVAKNLLDSKHILFVGRGVSYVTALEASLKLRELSYIDSQAIAAGELKHGTIALIDENMPVIAISPTNNLFEKTASNIEEIKARKGQVIALSDEDGVKDLKNLSVAEILVPKSNSAIEEALITIVPLQLLSYYVALFKGNDVDQPRNLAKSVTVE